MTNKNIKVFIGFSEVANYYTNLLKGFRELGVDYTFLTYADNIRGYDGDIKTTTQQKMLHAVSALLSSTRNNRLKYLATLSLFYLTRIYLFMWALFKHDVFIFNYNSSFLGFYDLPLMKLFKKKIIYVYHGSDGRPPYLSGNYIYEDYSLTQIFEISKKLYLKNNQVNKYADHIISAPSSSQFFTKNIIQYLAIGAPIDLGHIEIPPLKNSKKKVKIIHAPSVKKQKGSAIFSKMIEELKQEGYDIEYRELYNLPNSVVLEELATCDFVLDELYSDTTLAGLATEAAYFGKPTIVGGYYEDIGKDLKNIPVPPSLYVRPNEIKKAVIRLIEDSAYREQLGQEVKNYVETYWTPRKVAERYLKVIQDNIPSEWIYDPKEINYFYGWGVSKEDLKQFLKKYIAQYGKEGLFLSHNPDLENKILAFIRD